MIYKVYGGSRRIQSESNARIKALERIGRSDLPEEQKQQLRLWHYVKDDEQRNMASTIEKAIRRLNDDAKPEDVEPDWYRHFFNRQCIVSDSEMQEIWARILAGEANRPGSFSRRTLSIVSDIDKSEAETFAKLCGFCWEVYGVLVPLIVRDAYKERMYFERGLWFSAINHFQTIGLLQFERLSPWRRLSMSNTESIYYFGRELKLLDVKGEFQLGYGNFTECGRELAGICEREPVEELWEYVTQNYKEVFGSKVGSVGFV